MTIGLTGCEAAKSPQIVDISEYKIPRIRQSTIEAINHEVIPPVPPVPKQTVAEYIDALRLDIDGKQAAAWSLVELVEQCRKPLRELKREKISSIVD